MSARALDGYRCGNCNEVTRLVVLPKDNKQHDLPYRIRDSYINGSSVVCEMRSHNQCKPQITENLTELDDKCGFLSEVQLFSMLVQLPTDLRCQDILTKYASCVPCLWHISASFLEFIQAKTRVTEDYVVTPNVLLEALDASRDEREEAHAMHRKRGFQFPGSKRKFPTRKSGAKSKSPPATSEKPEFPPTPQNSPVKDNGEKAEGSPVKKRKPVFTCESCGKHFPAESGLKKHIHYCQRKQLLLASKPATPESQQTEKLSLPPMMPMY